MQEKALAGFHDLGVAFVEHRKLDPDRIVGDAHSVATSLQTCVVQTSLVENPGMRVEDLAHRIAGTDSCFAGLQCFDGGGVHPALRRIGLADHQRSHHRRVIAGIGTGPLQR